MKCKTCAKKLNIYAVVFMRCPYCNESLGKTIIHKAKGQNLLCGLGVFQTGGITHTTYDWKSVTCKNCLKLKR